MVDLKLIQNQQPSAISGAGGNNDGKAQDVKPQEGAPNSVFTHKLDGDGNGTINYDEAGSSIESMMDKSKTAAINLKSGTVTFASLFKAAGQASGFSVTYEQTGKNKFEVEDRANSTVFHAMAQQAKQINQAVTQQYEAKMQELEQEIAQNKKEVGEGDDKTTMFKDAKGKVVKSENADGTSDRFSHNEQGQMLSRKTYDKQGNVKSTVSNQYGPNGQLAKSETKDANGNVTSTTEYTYKDNGDGTQTVTETTKNEHGTFTETSTIDSKGRERQYTMSMQGSDGTSVDIKDNFDKKGRLDDSSHSTAKAGEGSNTTKTDFRGNGSIDRQQSNYTSADGTNIKHDNEHSKDGSLKNETITTEGNTQNIKHRFDDNRIKVKNSNGSQELPQGFKEIAGYENHVQGPDGKVYVKTNVKSNGKFELRQDYSQKALAYQTQFQQAQQNQGKVKEQDQSEQQGQVVPPKENAGTVPPQVVDDSRKGNEEVTTPTKPATPTKPKTQTKPKAQVKQSPTPKAKNDPKPDEAWHPPLKPLEDKPVSVLSMNQEFSNMLQKDFSFNPNGFGVNGGGNTSQTAKAGRPQQQSQTLNVTWEGNRPTVTINGKKYTGATGGVSFSPSTRRTANLRDLQQQISKEFGNKYSLS